MSDLVAKVPRSQRRVDQSQNVRRDKGPAGLWWCSCATPRP